jgi:sugar lactone lactonase YvrE
MRNSKWFASAGLALTVMATAGCGSSSTAPKNSPIGGLWVANAMSGITPEFSTNQLVSGDQTPAVRLSTTSNCTTGLALDASGNMWQSDCHTDIVHMYSAKTRNAGANVSTPTAVLTSTTLQGTVPGQMAFDSHGNLWVAACNGGNGGVLEYTAAQLTAAGSQNPTIIMYTSAYGNFCAWSIAFDASGNVWVADDFNGRVVEYGVAQLVAGQNDVTPANVITSAALSATAGVAFDKSGNLWVADEGGTVVDFTPAQQGAGGLQTPNVIVTMPANADPFGLAFDTHGSLWVSSYNNGVVYSLTSAQLVTGTPTPTVTLTTSIGGFGPVQPMFDPYATTKGTVSGEVVRHTAVAADVSGGAKRSIRRLNSPGSQPVPW